MKNKKGISVFIAMAALCFIFSAVKICQLENENRMLNNILDGVDIDIQDIGLSKCYFCNRNVKIQPVNEDFYIECPKCGLRTGYFRSKSDLIKYWNKE